MNVKNVSFTAGQQSISYFQIMKKILSLLVFVVLLTACQKVYFSQPQPRLWPALQSFPKKVQGEYPAFGSDISVKVTQKELIIHQGVGDAPQKFTLNDNVVIKYYQKHWIISIFDKDRGAWDVYAMDGNRKIKTLEWDDSLEKTLNKKFNKNLDFSIKANNRAPLTLKRREFKVLLKNHFETLK